MLTLIELIWTISPAIILILIAFPYEWSRKLFDRVKLSNFGNALKFLVPNHSLKTVSGWINHSCKVKTQKISEKKMGSRESKSVCFPIFRNTAVKDQRVNGSWCINSIQLMYINSIQSKCTLMNFKRNFQVKILSKQINKIRLYSSKTVSQSLKLAIEPRFFTGFADGESCFSINICKNIKYKIGWTVQANFVLVLHKKDFKILYMIKSYFRVGNIYSRKDGTCTYLVQSIKDLAVIIDHFDKYPLITQKQADYVLFKMVVNLIKNKQHLTWGGLQKIVAIKASMNKGLSLSLKAAFTDITPVIRPSVLDYKIKYPHWLAGFTTAEGCFLINIRSKPKMKTGYSVELTFVLVQHFRDDKLMKSLVEYLECGHVYKSRDVVELRITKFEDLVDKIIPIFDKYPIGGQKLLDYLDFVKVIKLMKNKAHLTEKGLNQIRLIKAKMNRGRK